MDLTGAFPAVLPSVESKPEWKPELTVDLRRVMDGLFLRFGENERVVHEVLGTVLASGGFALTLDQVRARLADFQRARVSLAELLQRPSIPQRTPPWYAARMDMITASDIAQALGKGKFGTQKQLILKKCKPQDDDAFAALANCPPIKWGTMYEQVAQELYTKRYGLRVHEFGLLRHPSDSCSFMGASPDGVTEAGVMLEIKCPYRRQITGEVPVQYYYQIQGQLEVCGLSECDYLEVALKELPREDFYESGKVAGESGKIAGESGKIAGERGIVAEFLDPGPGQGKYAYSGVDWPALALEAFEASCKVNVQSLGSVVFHYWTVETFSCVRVLRDDAFIKTMVADLGAFWSRILAYRADPALLESHGLEEPTREVREPRTRKSQQIPEEYAFRDDAADAARVSSRKEARVEFN